MKGRQRMENIQRTYLPAAGRNWALPFYDPLVKLLGLGAARRTLVDQANLQPIHHVLDVGCGTGTLPVLVKRLHPSVEVVGLDPDPKALARGRRKAQRAAVFVQFDQGFSDGLPYPEASFDRVFSSFMFHHLESEDREKMLRETGRVLKPEGSLHMVDFAGLESHGHGLLARILHSSERLKDNSDIRVLELMKAAGFEHPQKVKDEVVLLGHLRVIYYQASMLKSAS